MTSFNFPKSATFGAALGLVLGTALFLAFTTAAPAATEPMKNLYTGDFAYRGTSYRFEVGALAQVQEGRSRFVALIKDSKGATAATCERTLSGQAPFDVNSMTLLCQGAMFEKGPSRVKFSYAETLESPRLLISSTAGKRAKSLETELKTL